MITTIIKEPAFKDGTFGFETVEMRGLSTDTKPTTAHNGDVFYEMDTKKVYVFDETGTTWREV